MIYHTPIGWLILTYDWIFPLTEYKFDGDIANKPQFIPSIKARLNVNFVSLSPSVSTTKFIIVSMSDETPMTPRASTAYDNAIKVVGGRSASMERLHFNMSISTISKYSANVVAM